jgi:hypothetical protein
MFNDLRRGVVVRFVDIGENGDHQNLNFFLSYLDSKNEKRKSTNILRYQ